MASAGAAVWLVMSGVTYFGASTLSRDLEITPSANRFATHAAIHGALAGYGLGVAADLDDRDAAGAIFFGSVGGTAAGLALGQFATPAEMTASEFGADAGVAIGYGVARGLDAGRRGTAAALVAAGLAGYPLGMLYARGASYRRDRW